MLYYGLQVWLLLESFYLFFSFSFLLHCGSSGYTSHVSGTHTLTSDELVFYRNAHTACSTFDHTHSCFNTCSVYILHFCFSNFLYFITFYRSNFIFIWFSGRFVNSSSFLQKNCSRRSFSNKCK